MFEKLLAQFQSLWNNTYNAHSWESATIVLAVTTTLLVSFLFAFRMWKYENKSFLDWMIFLRETAWVLLAFRFTTALGFDWEGWSRLSWIVWLYIAVTTILAFHASQREHYLVRKRNKVKKEPAFRRGFSDEAKGD